jgi:ElaB/YqjD/DUF883 family membrane-anchored ribosome-binding protein
MFGTQSTKRRRKAERVAEDAWDNLRSAMDSTTKTAKSKAQTTARDAKATARNAKVMARRRTRRFADDAQTRLNSTAEEARRRATAAVDALAGRRPRTPWAWLAGSAIAGVLLGIAAATAGVRALSAAMHRVPSDPEFDAMTTGTPTGSATTPSTTSTSAVGSPRTGY